VKGFREPVRIYEVCWNESPDQDTEHDTEMIAKAEKAEERG
jgi:hypothetical protein